VKCSQSFMESELAFILGIIAGGDIRREAPTPAVTQSVKMQRPMPFE